MTDSQPTYLADFYAGKPRIEKLEGGAVAFTVGGPDVSFRLKRGTGYLDGLMIRVSGQYDVATADLVLLPRAPWSIFKRAKLQPSGRTQFLDSVSLYSCKVHEQHMRGVSPYVYPRDVRASGLYANTGRSALVESFPLAVGNNQTFELWFWIPTRRSPTDSRGRIPLDNDSPVTLYLTPSTEADLVTVPGNWAQDSMQVECWQVTYDEVPNSDQIKSHPRTHALIYEEYEQPAVIGWNEIRIEPDNSLLLGLGITLGLNGVQSTSDDVEELEVKLDKSYLWPSGTDPRAFYAWNKYTYGVPSIDGVFYFDLDRFADTDGPVWQFAGAPLQPSMGQPVNLDSRKLKEMTVRLKIASTATLGTDPRFYWTTRKLALVG